MGSVGFTYGGGEVTNPRWVARVPARRRGDAGREERRGGGGGSGHGGGAGGGWG